MTPLPQAPLAARAPALGARRQGACHAERLAFDGRGADYFRIWSVNLLLCLLSLGLFAPWALVRKRRWFAHHTLLAGDRFDFDGRGHQNFVLRVLGFWATLLLVLALASAAWPWGWRAALGLVAVGAWALLLGRFRSWRLAHTRWRGLRFGFDGGAVNSLRAGLPVVSIVTAALGLLWMDLEPGANLQGNGLALVALLAPAALPWAHARMQRFQREHSHLGRLRLGFQGVTAGFYAVYAKALVLAVAGVAAALPLAMALGLGLTQRPAGATAASPQAGVVLGLAMLALCGLAAWPYMATRLQQLVWTHTWTHTSRGDFEFRADLQAAPLWRTLVLNAALTMLSAGLYWPFAAVAIARLRIQALSVWSDRPPAEWRGLAADEVAGANQAGAADAADAADKADAVDKADKADKFDASVAAIATNAATDSPLLRGPLRPLESAWWTATPVVLFSTLALVLGLVWLEWQGVGRLAQAVLPAVPAGVDQAVGRQALALLDRQVLAPSRLPPVRQDVLRWRFQSMQRALGAAAPVPTARLEFRRSQSDAGFNAFALPQGSIVLMDGLLQALDDDEVMAVLAHELGHLQRRHGMQTALRSFGLLALSGVVLGEFSSVAASALASLQILRYSREAEREADTRARQNLAAAGLDPAVLGRVWRKLQAHQDQSRPGAPGLPHWLSTHPAIEERLRAAP